MRRTTRNMTLGGLGLVVAVALSGCGSASSDHPGSGPMSTMGTMGSGSASTSADSMAARPGDMMFAQMMIPHHEQAIEMADLALQNRSTSVAVKDLAAQIKAAQDPEIQTMKGWLRTWGAPDSAPMDHGGAATGMMSAQDMKGLQSAQASAFDRLWLTMMIKHHEGALQMAQGVLGTTQDAAVKTLAQDIIEAQKKEIATMQGLVG